MATTRTMSRESRRFLTIGRHGWYEVIVPTAPSAARRNAARLYAPHSLSGRVYWAGVRAREYSMGAALRGSFSLAQAAEDIDMEALLAAFRSDLGVDDVLPAILRTRSRPERMSILIMDVGGAPIAHAKLAMSVPSGYWDQEVAGLRWAGDLNHEYVRAPGLLSRGRVSGAEYLLTTAIPVRRRTARRPWGEAHVSALREIQRGSRVHRRLDAMPWWAGRETASAEWQRLAAEVSSTEPPDGYAMAAAHGDFAPWNMLVDGGTVWLFDWERFAPEVPIHVDRIHFALSSQLALARRSPERAARSLVTDMDREASAELGMNDLILACIYLQSAAKSHDTNTWNGLGVGLETVLSRR